MRVIFLDFDGVLNSVHDTSAGHGYTMGTTEWMVRQINTDLVARVQRVADAGGAVICLSTSWRHAHTHRALTEMLRHAGLYAPVVGQTPETRLPNSMLSAPRDHEIAEWLGWTGVTEFVVLDDWEMVHPEVAPRSVRIVDGITEADVDLAIGILVGLG